MKKGKRKAIGCISGGEIDGSVQNSGVFIVKINAITITTIIEKLNIIP
ncbi:MAG: hypothetical protein P8Y23_01170 [Candidatus Lokiarchaeota archaeon]